MSSPQSVPPMDREAALSQVGGDIQLLKEVAELFLQSQGEWLAEIHHAADAGDVAALSSAAHGLKGSVATFCAAPAVDAAFHLEMLGRGESRADAEEVKKAINTLELALAALQPELERL